MIKYDGSYIPKINTPLLWSGTIFYVTGFHKHLALNRNTLHISENKKNNWCNETVASKCSCPVWPSNNDVTLFESEEELTMFTLGMILDDTV